MPTLTPREVAEQLHKFMYDGRDISEATAETKRYLLGYATWMIDHMTTFGFALSILSNNTLH